MALREIHYYQKEGGLVFSRTSFNRLIKQLSDDLAPLSGQMRWRTLSVRLSVTSSQRGRSRTNGEEENQKKARYGWIFPISSGLFSEGFSA